MSQTESKIKLIFEGVERGVVAAAAKASAAVRSLDDDNSRLSKSADRAGSALGVMGKGMLALSAANSAVSVVGGVASALEQLAPAALLLPAGLLAGAAAMTTFKLATAGFGSAIGDVVSGDMEAFAKDTEKMTPPMREAAQGVGEYVTKLRELVQGNFWQGVVEDAKGLKTLLPVVTDGFSGVAGSLNEVVLASIDAMKSPFFRDDVEQIFDNTTDAIDSMSPALGKALVGFVGLGAVGSTYLPRLGTAIDNVATKFKAWVDKGVENGSIKRMIDGAIDGFKALGGIVKNVGSALGSVFRGLGGETLPILEILRNLTGEVAAFLKTASAQEGLRALGDTLRTVGEVVGRVVMTAFRELMPTLVKLAPIAQEVARTLGDLLVSAMETLGPVVRGVADVFNAFPGSAGAATVAVVGFVVAMKAVKAVNAVSELLGIGTAIGGVGTKAEGAAAKTGLFAGKLGLIKGLGAGLAIAAVAVELDKVNVAAAGGAENLQGFEDNLHDIVGAAGMVASGDIGGIFADISEDIDTMVMKFKTAQSPIGEFFHWLTGQKPDPIPVGVDVKSGEDGVNEFVGGISRRRGIVSIDGDVDPVTGKVTQVVRLADGSTGTITLDGEARPVNGKITSSIRFADGSTGTITLDADHRRADGNINATVRYANGQTAEILVRAATAQAIADIARAAQNRTMTITAIVRQRALPPGHTAATGGAVIGGSIVRGFAPGGPVSGPGTGTSDSVPAMLSNGEYVATARQVSNAGGPSAFGQLMSALNSPMRASARAASSSGGSGGGTVVQFSGNTTDALATLIMQMFRTGKIQIRATA